MCCLDNNGLRLWAATLGFGARSEKAYNMHEEFWDTVAPNYDAEIFNTLASDRNQLLGKIVSRLVKDVQVACDFGCGIGRFLPLLLAHANEVIATDFSATSLEIAKANLSPAKAARTKILKRDLTQRIRRFCSADLGLLINVLIMPDAEQRSTILSNVRSNLKKAAKLVVVVPSLESACYSYSRLIEWERKEGRSPGDAEATVQRAALSEITNLAAGVIGIEGTATKHFLAEELQIMLQDHRIEVLEKLRVEYDWSEEFHSPPTWMQAPYPWEWLFVAQRM